MYIFVTNIAKQKLNWIYLSCKHIISSQSIKDPSTVSLSLVLGRRSRNFGLFSATSCLTTQGSRSGSPPPRLSWVILTLQQLNNLQINTYWNLNFKLNLNVKTYQAVFEAAGIELVEWIPHLDTDVTISLKMVSPLSSRRLSTMTRPPWLPQNSCPWLPWLVFSFSDFFIWKVLL